MKATEVRTKSDDELADQLLALKKEAFNLRFQRASGQLENTARVRQVRPSGASIFAKAPIRHCRSRKTSGGSMSSRSESR